MNIRENIHEMNIKVKCARWLKSRFCGEHDGVLINEYSANRSKARADLVYVSPAEVIAVEIKSSRDNIGRLEGQIFHLKKLYNRVEVVTTSKHRERARIICAKMHVGLHLIEGDVISTILKGRRRNIETVALKRLFPIHIRRRKDFAPTEAFYRSFLAQKYGSGTQSNTAVIRNNDIDATFIRKLNPHFTRRARMKQRRDAYLRDLEALSLTLQSTHSSSNCSEETSRP